MTDQSPADHSPTDHSPNPGFGGPARGFSIQKRGTPAPRTISQPRVGRGVDMAQQPASKQIAPTSSGTMQPKGSNPAARSRLAPCERQDAAQLGCPDGDDSVASVPNQASPVGVFGAFIGGVSVLLLVALSLHVVASAPASTPDSRGVGSQRADLVGVLAQLAGRQSSADDRLSPTVDLPSTRQRSARVACVALLLAESTGTGLAPEASRGRVRLALLHLPPPANLARGC